MHTGAVLEGESGAVQLAFNRGASKYAQYIDFCAKSAFGYDTVYCHSLAYIHHLILTLYIPMYTHRWTKCQCTYPYVISPLTASTS